MHAEKIQLVDSQIQQLVALIKAREIQQVYFVACGGSLATLQPGKYILQRSARRSSRRPTTRRNSPLTRPCA